MLTQSITSRFGIMDKRKSEKHKFQHISKSKTLAERAAWDFINAQTDATLNGT